MASAAMACALDCFAIASISATVVFPGMTAERGTARRCGPSCGSAGAGRRSWQSGQT